MRLSLPTFGGLVHKVREPRSTARENRKKWIRRISTTEALLRPFSLNAWRKTQWSTESLSKTGAVRRVAAESLRKKPVASKASKPAGK